MKKLFTLLGLLAVLTVSAQEYYFTTYNFTVAPENGGTVYRLFNDYFSKNKPEGVTVSLYENHFKDHSANFTHSVVFSGSLDAVNAIYAGGSNAAWDLFLTRVNQHIKANHSSAMGSTLAVIGDTSQKHPYQLLALLQVDNGSTFVENWKKINAMNPEGRVVSVGNIQAGRSPDGANFWIVNGFKDMKSAMGGLNRLMTEAQREARSKAMQEVSESWGGEVRWVRNGLRVLMGQW